MYIYKISSGNPEGFDFFYSVTHDKLYSQEEFVDLIEELLAECYEEHWVEYGFSMLNAEKFSDKLINRGFKFQREEWIASYDLEPYWGGDYIKSKRLLAAINKKNKDEI